MNLRKVGRLLAVASATVVTAGLLSIPAQAAPPPAPPPGDSEQFLVVARSAAEYAGLRDDATASGAKVVREMPEINTFVMVAGTGARSSVLTDSRVLGVAADQLRSITTEDRPAPNLSSPGLRSATEVQVPASASAPGAQAGIDPDPAFDYRGLLWNYRRIGLPQGWQTTAGRPAVTVGVADTGLDFTHAELRPRVSRVIDLTQTEDPPICETFFGTSDRELAARFGGPARTDWNGHGTWIGGNIAAALNGTGMNGIAPRVSLVSLKISQWCGFAYDSTILAAFLTAANTGMDVVSISFGGYLDRSAPGGNLLYRLYTDTVAFARSQGTAIVASAGNEHVRVGAGGRVVSHGSLTPPGPEAELFDLFGWYQTPGGIPGVVNVSATGNVVNGPSRGCPPGSTGTVDDPDATCKPAGDRHQPFGVGRTDQLAYYSNYGPRIDIAAPGGARKFNLPVWDRGGTPGFPYTTADLTNVWEVFSTTSNWAVEIPCFTFSRAAGFPERQCYTSIQGTSMAAPHVSAAIALTASAHPGLRHKPAALIARVKAHAVDRVNRTPGLSPTDRSPGDLIRQPCRTGFCHLGGPAIPSREAYGAGLLNVARP